MLKNILKFVILTVSLTCNISSTHIGVFTTPVDSIDEKLVHNVTTIINENHESTENRELARRLVRISAANAFPLDILFALFETESGWNEKAYSEGCFGWGQLKQGTAAKYDERIRTNASLLYVPSINAVVTLRHLIDLHQMYKNSGELSRVLYSYNTGKLTKKPFVETSYINKIFGRSLKYRTRIYGTT